MSHYLQAIWLGFMVNLKHRLLYLTLGWYDHYWDYSMHERIKGIVFNARMNDTPYRWNSWWG